MTTYRLWPSTNGPSAPTNYAGNFISGMSFCVTGEAWFQGYWWWVCPNSGGSHGFQLTTATKCALWQIPADTSTAQLVPGSVVTSGTLTAGQWNYIPLATPIQLSLGGSPGMTPEINQSGGAQYIAAIGCNGPFPDTNNTWGTGQTYPNGITNGPLTAFSTHGAGMAALYNSQPQGIFSSAGSDPSTTCPQTASSTDNFWVDVQVSNYSGAPAGATLRLWPNLPRPVSSANGDNTKAVSGTAFTLTQSCALQRIWMYNPPLVSTGLPSRCGIWNSNTKTLVSGTDSGTSPTWKVPGGGTASTGAGWIYVDYTNSGVVLPGGNYVVSFYDSVGVKFYVDSANYWFAGTDPRGSAGTVGGPGWNGISVGGGILTAPNLANGPLLVYDDASGTFPGQDCYQPGPASWQYPSEFEATSDWGETRWADVELLPVTASGSGLLIASFP